MTDQTFSPDTEETGFAHRSMVTEIEAHRFSTEASQLSLRPGVFPAVLETNIGNGQPFLFHAKLAARVEYRQDMGCSVLIVFVD